MSVGAGDNVVRVDYDFRSPIFYDNNDTTYYLDPNSGGVSLRIAGAIQSNHTSWTGEMNKIQWHASHMYFQNTSDGNFTFRQANGNEPFILTIGGAYGTAQGSWRAPVFYDVDNTAYFINPASTGQCINLAGDIYMGQAASSSNIFMGDNDEGQRQIHCNSNRIGFLTQGGGWGSYCNDDGSWTSDYDISTGTVFRGQVFYDTNNGAYYIDPTSNSVMFRLCVRKPGSTFTSGNSGQLEINNAGSGDPYINFHAEGRYGAQFGLASDNRLTTYGWSAGGGYTGLDVGQTRIMQNDGTNAVSFVTSRPGIADSFYVHASDAWSPNGEAATLKIGHMSWTGRSINAGGSINQYGGDYAEYMTKNGDFTIAKGDVCGIDVNGKLTKTFSEAISFVVKSTNPGLVGGDTWGAEEEVGIVLPTEPLRLPDEEDESLNARKAQYAIDKPIYEAALQVARAKVDRIAFCGQVPVNVTGAVSGQYIVPVNDNGAIKGIAIDEDDLTMSQYIKAVGKVIKVVDGRPTIIVKIS
jgi:hypothetical protein